MSGQGDGFLNRWSRLKREAAQPAEAPASKETESEDQAALPEPVFDPARLEIPLPSLEDLKAGDTLVAFMQKGVPEAIRNAALRKMWALDPMVRDFRSEALDYAWDWNTPGGVPGGGPLGPADQIEEMVEALFRPSRPAEEPDQEDDAKRDTPEASPEPAEPLLAVSGPDREAETPVSSATESKNPDLAPKKRHGGAMPQV